MSNRKVSTDALETLGTILNSDQKRDAIHLAVEPVTAGEPLRPGEHITVKDGIAYSESPELSLGIVDPFIHLRFIRQGERFWFVMKPRLVHSLRHVWTHPDFPDPVEVAPLATVVSQPVVDTSDVSSFREQLNKSTQWLTEYAATIHREWYDEESTPLTLVELLEAARMWLDVNQGTTLGSNDFQVSDEFWDHYEIYTGIKVPEDKRGGIFHCSC